jgi:simple sugar transport system substrate-binding protein
MLPSRSRVLSALFAILFLGGVADAAEKLRFIMVTHGAASNPFWATIKNGAERAAQALGVDLVYRAPETFDLDKMASLITAAVKEKPDGLIVSIPNADTVAAPLRAAVGAGIPVVSINSGFDVSASLGALLHVGQSEYEAGRVAGDAMRKLGSTKALCLNHELGNVALDLRCKGFIDGFEGSVEVLAVPSDPEEVGKMLSTTLEADAEFDAVLALSAPIAGEPAVKAVKSLEAGRVVRVASFDTSDAILNAVADRAAAFAIDQQPFLQGYLPVEYLVLLKRDGVIPVSNVSTGPRLITAEEAARRLGRAARADDGAGAAEKPVEPGGG